MSESTIASVAGIIVSLAFSYVPGLKEWFDALAANYKRLVMLGALVLAVGVIFATSCLGYATEPACTVEGAKALLPLFIAAVIANQGTFLLTPSKS
jgi:hypothetical protein